MNITQLLAMRRFLQEQPSSPSIKKKLERLDRIINAAIDNALDELED